MTNATSPVPCPTWQAVLDGVAGFFAAPGDPFVPDTLVVPSFGHGRYIAQHLSLGAPGICAGIEMVTPSQLAAQLLGVAGHDDPWRGAALVVAIADILADGSEPVGRAGLEGASRVAQIFAGYLRRCPAMLFAWDAGAETGPDGGPLPRDQAWQPDLWRRLAAKLAPSPHPARARLEAAALVPNRPGRHGVVLMTPPDPIDEPVIDALAAAGAPIWSYRPVADARASRYDPRWPVPLATRPGDADDDRASLLRRVQADMAAGRAPSGRRSRDGSIQIHASHGPSRQVEVLRETLTAVFDRLPDLQPRDVLVLTTKADVYDPLIEAAFAPDLGHPAAQLRVQAARRRDNLIAAGLIDSLSLPATRATADDLLAWCRNPLVARCFGLETAYERLSDLLDGAAIVWGIDYAHRSGAGVTVRAGTWLDGVQRLALGLATANPVGSSVPAVGVRPQDADIAGGLAELVSRLRRAVMDAATPAPLSIWADRLARTADELFAVGPDQAWMSEDVNATLALWRRDAAAVDLTAADVIGLLRHDMRTEGRPTYGNGSLQVRQLGDLQGVGFRVICVIGLDDASFPAPLMTRADDLLFDQPDIGSDARRRSRVALRDALLAAQDEFIVVTRGADERTGAPVPAPVAVLDLLAACGVPGDGLVSRHSLQDYSGRAGPSQPSPPGWKQFAGPAAPPSGGEVTLDDVEAALANPARYLLQRACNLTLTEPGDAADQTLPIEFDSLRAWSTGQTLLDDLIAGEPLTSAKARALASRFCPPGALGVQAVGQLLGKIGGLPQEVAALGPADARAVDIVADGWHLTGAVTLRGQAVVVTRYGRVKAAQVLACWVRLLALAAQGQASALLGQAWATGGRVTLTPPDAAQARQILGEIARLTAEAGQRLVPLPADTSAAFAGALGAGYANGTEQRAADAFAGRFGEGHHPAWRALVGRPSLTALRDAGAFDELSTWLWQPIKEHIVRPDRGGAS